MISTRHSLASGSLAAPGGPRDKHHHARAFSGGSPVTVDLQAQVRFCEGKPRGSLVATGVPGARAKQILASVLSLHGFQEVPEKVLHVAVHRPDGGRFHNDYCLALAVAMVSSLIRRSVGEEMLFIGNVGLHNRIEDAEAKRIDRLNDAIAAYEVETPITIICSESNAIWMNSSSTVTVKAVRTLADAVAVVWPGVELGAW